MEQRLLGRTGISISTFGLGTGQFGAFGQIEEAQCLRIAHAAFDAGVTFVDTADFYSFGQSEEITAKAITGRRDRLVLATKCGMAMSDDPNERGGSRRWITASIERSLRRLKTDYVDLYQLHTPDIFTPIDETVDAFNDLMKAGKIRHFGLSNSTAAGIVTGALGARLRGRSAPYTEQSAYSIFARGPEEELLPACLEHDMGFLAYSPLDGGWLSGKFRTGAVVAPSARHRLTPARWDMSTPLNQRKLEIADRLALLAEEAGLALPHIAVAFVLSHRAVSCALLGGSSVAQIEAQMAGQDLVLDEMLLDRIDALVAPGANLAIAPPPGLSLRNKSLRRRPPSSTDASRQSSDHIRKLVSGEAE